MNAKLYAGMATVAMIICVTGAYPCKTARPISNVDMVREADVIVRVEAEKYALAPKNQDTWTGFEPDSKISFKVLEVIRGKIPADYLILPGILVQTDDFNDQPPPYSSVRSEGRKGNCFASSYRSGGQFLLILKKRSDGALSVNWYALAPVNEQLHSANDPWLLWVRKQASKSNSKPSDQN